MDSNKLDQQESSFEEEYKCICEFEKISKKLNPIRTALKFGTSGSVTLPAVTAAGTTFNVARVNIDTRGFRRPCIKLEFASNIVTTGALLTLNFQIYKLCKNQLVPMPVGSVWVFSRLYAVTEGNTFTFYVCDSDIYDEECCNYSMIATVAGVATVGVTTINNATLSAIVTETCGC